jgi:3-dehydroquinate synthase
MMTPDPSSGATFRSGGAPVHPHDAATGRLPYPVIVAPGALDTLADVVAERAPAHRYVVISDSSVGPLHADRIATALAAGNALRLDITPGEAEKTRESWAHLTDAMLAAGCGRDTTVIAVGGGVVCDLAGFVAATYMRGVPVVQVPTTLLAMVDASVGGKTGVDTPHGKNLVGAFHPPAAVIADPLVLGTLPVGELVAGLAEVVKHGVIADAAYFDAVELWLPSLCQGLPVPMHRLSDELARLIAGSVAIKATVVVADEREGGVRKILNFGHTVGHAVEALSGYALRHGEAVAIGMVAEARIGELAGATAAGTSARIEAALRSAGLPVQRPAAIPADDVLAATRGDKKARAGIVEYALPARIGAMRAVGGRWSEPVADALVLEAIA